ncbi:MAG: OmpA family protein [Pseudomonadota bacterium]
MVLGRATITILAMGMLVAGCERGPFSPPEDLVGAKWDVDAADALPRQADPYFSGLQDRYVALARAELAEFDWVDTAYFVKLAQVASTGTPTPPVNPEMRNLSPEMTELLRFQQAELAGFVLSRGGRLRGGETLAEAHAAFECWVQELEEVHQTDQITDCREQFEIVMEVVREIAPLPADLAVVLSEGGGVQIDGDRASTTLDQPFAAGSTSDGRKSAVLEEEVREVFGQALDSAPEPPQVFRLGFGFGSARLDDADRAVIAQAVAEALSRPHAEMVITGHADAPGASVANLALSRQRAAVVRRSVVRALAEDEAAGEKVTVTRARGRGELELLEEVPDRSELNRRVEILVR